MVRFSRVIPLLALLVCALACRYQPVWESTPGPTPLPSDTPTPGPTHTPTSIIPTAVVNSGACQTLRDALLGRWTNVRSSRYAYSFEIPVGWAVDDSQGENALIVVSDPQAASGLAGSSLPCGLFKIYVVVQGVETWVGSVPDSGYQPVKVAGYDGWRIDSGSLDGNPPGRASQISFPAGDYYYLINIQYTPAAQAAGQPTAGLGSDYDEAVDTWLATFQVISKP